MNKMLIKKLVEEFMGNLENAENGTSIEKEEVFFTRRNFLKKVQAIKYLDELVDNPMMNQIRLMQEALDFAEALGDSASNDIDMIHSILIDLELPVPTIKGFLNYLQLDVEGKQELMVDDTKYNEIWEKISQRVKMKVRD